MRAGDSYDESEPGEQVVVGRLTRSWRSGPVVRPAQASRSCNSVRAARADRRDRGRARWRCCADGRIVIGGRASSTDGSERAVVARLTAAGRLDTSFARGGRALVQLGLRSAARAASSELHALAARGGRQAARRRRGHRCRRACGRRCWRTSPPMERSTVLSAGDGVVGVRIGSGDASAPATLGRYARPLPAPEGALVTRSRHAAGRSRRGIAPSGRLDCGYGVGGIAGIDAGSTGADPELRRRVRRRGPVRRQARDRAVAAPVAASCSAACSRGPAGAQPTAGQQPDLVTLGSALRRQGSRRRLRRRGRALRGVPRACASSPPR